jgi:CHAD domain-containing protein
VVIALLTRKVRSARNAEQKKVWEMALEATRRKLQREMRRARRKIANRKMFTLAQRVQGLIESGSIETVPQSADPLAALQTSVAVAYSDWREGLTRAKSSTDPAEIHAFRIQTKRLRYRIELLRDIGSASAQSALSSLRSLQDELGRWHDGLAFTRMTAEALAGPEYLVTHLLGAATILRKLHAEHERHLNRVLTLLVRLDMQVEASALHAAVMELLTPTHDGGAAVKIQPEQVASANS